MNGVKGKFEVRYRDGGRPPVCEADPAFPNGFDLDLTRGWLPACTVTLPYPCPSPNIGRWDVRCTKCGTVCIVSAASRPDDPRTVKLPCGVYLPRGASH